MSRTAIVAQTSSPRGVAGNCPQCGGALYNPAMNEHMGLSMTLRWEIHCARCGARVTVENPRFRRGKCMNYVKEAPNEAGGCT